MSCGEWTRQSGRLAGKSMEGSDMASGGLIDILVRMTLMSMRLVLFGLALGLTIISYQSYSDRGSKRLESAFIGFAFISMGLAVSTLNSQLWSSVATEDVVFYFFQIAEVIPFIVGFAMLYVSLYR